MAEIVKRERKRDEEERAKLPLSLLRDPKKKKTHLYKNVRRPCLSTVLTSCRRRSSVQLLTSPFFRSTFVSRFFLEIKIALYCNQRGAVIKMLHRFTVLAIFAVAAVSATSPPRMCKYFTKL